MDSTSQDREGAGQLARVDRMGKGALPGVLAALMALTSDAVLTLDGDARILTANAQAEAKEGAEGREEAATDSGEEVEQ